MGSTRRILKRIEDSFQQLASDILAGNVCHVGEADKETINRFYALWWTRARHRDLPQQEIQMNAVTGGGLTRDQEEMLEKNGVMFARAGGKFPARQLNGFKIQMMIDHYFESLASAQWGIIEAHEGEFIVPDIPLHTILPLTPTICLVSPAPERKNNQEKRRRN